VADLVRNEVRSYRQLPMLIYHIQTKWRDDPRPRAGLIRVREFTMKDSYSLDRDFEGLDAQYRAHYQAYFNIFHRCDLPVMAVASDVGMMGGSGAHEFMYLTPVGEDTLLICDECTYAANRQIARFLKPEAQSEEQGEIQKVETPELKTIGALADFLEVEKARTAKAVFMVANIAEGEEEVERFVFALTRGDMDVNETKLANAVNAKSLRPATEAEIRGMGLEPGYASPLGLEGGVLVVDDAIPNSPNLVAGANEEGYHLMNVNYGRDFEADIVTDIALAEEGDLCPRCSNPLHTSRGVEVGNIFKLGTFYSDAMGCTYLDEAGESRPVVMGSYGIGSGRLLASVAEEHHDEGGLVLPISVAPYHVHLVLLGDGEEQAEQVHSQLRSAGIETLYDDRDESPGVKFNDADLIGIPLRLTVSPRSIGEGGVELKHRGEDETVILPFGQLVPLLQERIEALFAAIAERVVEVPYE
jgi:prolyl-tRNA synthetase